MEKAYICIDLKSFYASVECVERGLDPFKVNLAVADPDRSKSTICLAITPAMKQLGIKNRCRVHEIPPWVDYITAKPRMQLYIDYSSRIYSIYLKYIAAEDIHVYSIDECFIDVTPYLGLYHMTPKEIAVMLMDAVFKETGITATAGVGTNLYLAKIAMDIVAKHVDDHIGILDEYSFRRTLWNHLPLTDFWMIGAGTVRRLASYGIFTMGDIARASVCSEEWMYRQFGINAELLIDHAWGYEPCTMADIKNYRSKDHSLSSGQVLMRNYSFDEARVVVREMTDLLVLDLVSKHLMTRSLTLYISYDHRLGTPSSGGSVNLGNETSSTYRIMNAVDGLYCRIASRSSGIRRLNICCQQVTEASYLQFDLFTDPDMLEKERNIQHSILDIHHRYGKNALIRGVNLVDCSTLMERNCQIGGHRA